jgi:hypothetical protein
MKTLKNIIGFLLVAAMAIVCFGLLQVLELMP